MNYHSVQRGGSGDGDSAFGGIPCAFGGVRDEGNSIGMALPRSFGGLLADSSPFQGDRGGVAPSGAARSAGGVNSLLHEKSPADADHSEAFGPTHPPSRGTVGVSPPRGQRGARGV